MHSLFYNAAHKHTHRHLPLSSTHELHTPALPDRVLPQPRIPPLMNRSSLGKNTFCTLLSKKWTEVAPKYTSMFSKFCFKDPLWRQRRCLWFPDNKPLLYTVLLFLWEQIQEEMLAWRELLYSFSSTEALMSMCAGTTGCGSSEVQ